MYSQAWTAQFDDQIQNKNKLKVFIIVMKTYWLQVETKNLLTISTINTQWDLCQNKNPAFPEKHH